MRVTTRAWGIAVGSAAVLVGVACGAFDGDAEEPTPPADAGATADAGASSDGSTPCSPGGCGIEVLATGQQGAWGIAVDDDSVYFTTKVKPGSLVRCPKTGCGSTPDVLVSGLDNPYGVAVDGQGVYYTSSGDGALRVLPKGTHGLGTALRDGGAPSVLRLASGYVYWLNPSDVGGAGSVNSCALPACTQGFFHIFEIAEGLAVDGPRIYWTAGGAGGYVAVSPPGVEYNHPPYLVANGPALADPHAVAVDDTNLYVAAGVEPGVVVTMSKLSDADAGIAPKLLAKDLVNPSDVVVDVRHVFFTTRGTAGQANGTVVRVGKDGADLSVLARGQEAPAFLAQDAEHLYWTNTAGGTVMRIRKDAPTATR